MLIILDRDGVINYESPDYIKSADEWRPIPKSIAAIAKLKHDGHTVVIATNQSGIGRGFYTEIELNAMHQKLADLLANHDTKLDGIYYCPHHPDANCHCRKPKTGLLENIRRDFNYDLKNAWLVGDSKRDLEAGKAMGCKLALVKTGNGPKTLLSDFDMAKVLIVDNLHQFSQHPDL